MTAQTPIYLKGRFEQNDIPQGADYEDLIDSFLNVATSSLQTVVGAVSFTNQIYGAEVNSALVSATSGIFSFVSAQTIFAAFLNVGTVSATSITAGGIDASRVSAAIVSAQDIHIERKIITGYQDLLPSGVAQASAASVVYDITKISVTAAATQERAVKLSEHHAGRVQYIVNDSTSVTAATVYPSNGCNFIGTAANAGMLLSAGQTIQILHVNASAYSFVRY
jgi:hypothetical protein